MTIQTSPEARKKLRRIIRDAFRRHFRPLPKLTLSEWADTYRKLSPEASAEPGQWYTDRVPYLREALDAAGDPACEQAVYMFSSQSSKTEIILNALGYFCHQDPAPILLVEPRVEDCKALSKDRISPMLRDSPVLRGLVRDARTRDSGNTVLHKQFPGGHLTLAGANSAAGLSMRPIRVVGLDEVSRYPASAGTEGDPVSLATKRTTTFWNRKIIMASSPAIEGACRITAAYEETDQRKFHVPCPKCGAFQILEWSRVEWSKDETGHGRKHRPHTARYCCIHCPAEWTDADRWRVLPMGKWVPTYPDRTAEGRWGFWISQLYSPWKKLGELAVEYLDSRDNVEREKAFQNTVLGLPFRIKGEGADAERLWERRENYRRGEVPDGALVLVAGVDVHPDRLECEIVGYGRGLESWSIDYLVLQGDPTKPDVWDEFDELVRTATWDRSDGSLARLSRLAVDSGDSTAAVYAWWRRINDARVMLVKGDGRKDMPLSSPTWVEVSRGGKKVKRGVQVWSLGVDWFKDELSGHLRLAKPEEGQSMPGYCHFPAYGRDYFDQLTAEEKILESSKAGYGVYRWHKVRPRNEALDCRVYARAAAMAQRLDAFRPRDWDVLEERIGVRLSVKALPVAEPSPPPPDPYRIPPPVQPPTRPAVARYGRRRSVQSPYS
ncbi:MAG: hypothetical protein K0R61_3612 [Microvirga sp.]|jgi:phage terminase large subunit GpA-like protein|nr:hypothetical protein [Microvirga sp.]